MKYRKELKMIKNKLLFLCLLLTACETVPYKLSNLYYETAYITTKSEMDYKNNTEISFGSIEKPFTLMGKDLPQVLEIYQDSSRQCLLFSYSNKELSQMISMDDGMNIDNQLFVITKDGLQFISYKTLKELKKDSIAHQYNPSLCK